MFGPNGLTKLAPYMHHRQGSYRRLLQAARAGFRDALDVPADQRLLFMTGSGTLALEAVLTSLPRSLRVHEPGEEFAGRLRAWAIEHDAIDEPCRAVAWVQYETAASKFVEPPLVPKGALQVVDAVSSFPYYDLPPHADAWVTVSSKQLRAMPLLAIIGLSPAAVDQIYAGSAPASSYLSLRKWLDADARDESPHSPAIDALWDLNCRLGRFRVQSAARAIDVRRGALLEALPPDATIGMGPVVTIKGDALPPALVARWDLYRHHGNPQVFLWSGDDDQFGKFVSEVALVCQP